ncbi:hypothetical protein EOL73_03705 [Candidatus Saccharibacteria bacterium]|nr:hypothetical protein [Candidatus Saccharibacteria bacterium]NCU40834.1 hypothetical protein [Candidatus Saccharibacteria bacterium]
MDETTPKSFTKLEIAIWLACLVVLATLLWTEKLSIEAQQRDSTRKFAMNAIRANLEEVTYPSLKGYPESLNSKYLTAVDKSLLQDQKGVVINRPNSEYSYEPSSCSDGVCQHYILRAVLEKEAPFIQKSLR